MKTIVLVSSGQPSANPRLVKEATALSAAGYMVKVIFCPLSPWADEYDRMLFQKHPDIEWIKAGYHPDSEKLKYLYARIRQKMFQLLYKFFGNRFHAAIKSMVLFSQELIQAAKKQRADLYIGHNLGAMPAIHKAASRYGAKASFDFEDFHRGEDAEGSEHWIKTKLVEDRYVPQLYNATTASPLITEAYKKLYPGLAIQTINNCFSAEYAPGVLTELPIATLKLFWFSQTIGRNRGLETVIEAAGNIKKYKTEIGLLGNCNEEMKTYFRQFAFKCGLNEEQLQFLPAVEEKLITGIASNYHLGIASEVPYILNRELCLTNKLFVYLLAGNAILYSNTKAQSKFLEDNPGTGMMYEQGNAKQLASILELYLRQPELLLAHRTTSFITGKEQLNWENEQQVLLQHLQVLFS